MDTLKDSETSNITEIALKVEDAAEEGFGNIGISYIFGVLLLLLLLFLLFAGVYYCKYTLMGEIFLTVFSFGCFVVGFSYKNKISKSADMDTPDEEDDDENENPPVRNTDSAPLDVTKEQ